MSDNRVMSSEAQAAERPGARAAELVADPDSLDAATFARFGVAERSALFKADPDAYRRLVAEADKAADMARLGGAR